jgi:hypothetical protein
MRVVGRVDGGISSSPYFLNSAAAAAAAPSLVWLPGDLDLSSAF